MRVVMNPPNEVERDPTRTGRAAIGSAFLLAEPSQRADSETLKACGGSNKILKRKKYLTDCGTGSPIYLQV